MKMFTLKSGSREFAFYGLREFFIKTPWLGEAYAEVTYGKNPVWFDAWSSDDQKVVEIIIGQ